jgi:plastocyanin
VSRVVPVTVVISVLLLLAFATMVAAKPGSRPVQILDNCDPASFNAMLGEGACVREGGLTFDKFIEHLLRKGDVASWRFSPGHLKTSAGGTVTAINRGGEFHTFTEVAQFGGGCIEELNALLGLSPVAECAGFPGIFFTTGVPPGASLETDPLSEGTHRFQCLIHPWQRTTVEAR